MRAAFMRHVSISAFRGNLFKSREPGVRQLAEFSAPELTEGAAEANRAVQIAERRNSYSPSIFTSTRLRRRPSNS